MSIRHVLHVYAYIQGVPVGKRKEVTKTHQIADVEMGTPIESFRASLAHIVSTEYRSTSKELLKGVPAEVRKHPDGAEIMTIKFFDPGETILRVKARKLNRREAQMALTSVRYQSCEHPQWKTEGWNTALSAMVPDDLDFNGVDTWAIPN